MSRQDVPVHLGAWKLLCATPKRRAVSRRNNNTKTTRTEMFFHRARRHACVCAELWRSLRFTLIRRARLDQCLGRPIVVPLLRGDIKRQNLRSTLPTAVYLHAIVSVIVGGGGVLIVAASFLVILARSWRVPLPFLFASPAEQRPNVILLMNDVRGKEQHVRTTVRG